MIRLMAHPDCCCCSGNQLQLTVALTDLLANSYDGQSRHETHLISVFSILGLRLCSFEGLGCVVHEVSGAFLFVSQYLGSIELTPIMMVTPKSVDKGEEEMGF